MRLIVGFIALIGAMLSVSLAADVATPNWQARVTRTADGGFLLRFVEALGAFGELVQRRRRPADAAAGAGEAVGNHLRSLPCPV